jgi:hypothetical protein
MQQQAKDLLLALGNLVTRGLVKRAGHNPIPGSPVAFRLVRAASPHDLAAATSAAAAIVARPLRESTKGVRQSRSRESTQLPKGMETLYSTVRQGW